MGGFFCLYFWSFNHPKRSKFSSPWSVDWVFHGSPCWGREGGQNSLETWPSGWLPLLPLSNIQQLLLKEGRDNTKLETGPRAHSLCLKGSSCHTDPANSWRVEYILSVVRSTHLLGKTRNWIWCLYSRKEEGKKAAPAFYQESPHLPWKPLTDFCLNLMGWNRSCAHPSCTGGWGSVYLFSHCGRSRRGRRELGMGVGPANLNCLQHVDIIFKYWLYIKGSKTCQGARYGPHTLNLWPLHKKPMSLPGISLSLQEYNVSWFGGSKFSATKDLSYFFFLFLHGIHLLEHSVYKLLLLGNNQFSHFKKFNKDL